MATYDPKLVQVSFGNTIISDFAEGTMVEVTPSGDSFELKQGAAGATEWVNKNMNMYDITFTLQQTSPTNDTLSNAHAADRANNGGVAAFQVKDAGPGGTTLVSLGEARVTKAPNATFADTTTGRQWTLKGCKPTSYLIGGMA